MGGFQKTTFRALAKEEGVSRTRIDQIYGVAIERIKWHCKRKGVCPYETHILEVNPRDKSVQL